MRNLIIVFVLFSVLFVQAADNKKRENVRINPDNNKSVFNFNAEKYNLLEQAEKETGDSIQAEQKRVSGVKAAFMSALVPGAGEFYTKSYWRAALFAALEIGFWTANIIYDNKGDKEDERMRAFGDEHWNERKYWAKIYKHAKDSNDNPWEWEDLTLEKFGEGEKEWWQINNSDFNDPVVLERLRDAESKLGTHTLPRTKTQQYYEMIYKYLHQFGVGWDDAPSFIYYDVHANITTTTPNINEYRDMRNLSNDYYEVATTMVSLVLANHLLSAIDAAIAAKQYNKKYHYSLHVGRRFTGSENVYTYGVNVTW